MTPLGLTVLRRTATLVHAVPGLRVRLRHDGNALLEVLRPAHPAVAPSGRWTTPCGFRRAVGRAVQASRDGRTLAVLGLDAGVDPAVEIGAPTGRLLAGYVALLPTVAGSELAFATTAAAATVAAMAEDLALDVRCHPDPITESSLLVLRTDAAPRSASFDEQLQQVHALVARCAVEELVDDRDSFLSRADDPGPERPRRADGPGPERPRRADEPAPAMDHSRDRPPRS